jgi:serine protease
MSLALGTTYGVAKGATGGIYRVLDCSGSGSYSGILTAISDVQDRQVASPFAAVLTASLAGGFYQPLNDAMNGLVTTYNTAVVVAAGNNDGDACALSPASAADALAVCAMDRTDTVASFSNWGDCVSLCAPGVNTIAAWYTSNSATATLSGTSMATPISAGTVALEMQRRHIATPGSLPDPAQSMAAVVAMATQNWITVPTNNNQRLPLVFSSEGLAPVPQPPPPPPPPPAPQLNNGTPLPRLGRPQSSDSGWVVDNGLLVMFASVSLIVVYFTS